MLCKIERLEHALCAWEDYWFCMNAVSKMQKVSGQNFGPELIPFVGPVKYWSELRAHLLKIRNSAQFEVKKFCLPTGISQSLTYNWLRLMSPFPTELAAWVWESRRAFRITKELQVLLGSTLLGDVRWCDVSWPFDAFVVLLDIPIKSSFNCEYDCILVSHYIDTSGDEQRELISFRLFSTALDGSQRVMSLKKQRKVTRLIQAKQWEKANTLLINHKIPRLPVDPFYVRSDEQRNVVESLAEVSCGTKLYDVEAPQWDIAAQIVVGLCLYLNTLPPGSSHRSDWKPTPRSLGSPNPNSVVNEAHICTVSSIVELQKKDREFIRLDGGTRTFHELCAHFRRGHWRRRPGEGQDPNAPRTVWVRPTLVRRDRLQDGAIVGGTENIVS